MFMDLLSQFNSQTHFRSLFKAAHQELVCVCVCVVSSEVISFSRQVRGGGTCNTGLVVALWVVGRRPHFCPPAPFRLKASGFTQLASKAFTTGVLPFKRHRPCSSFALFKTVRSTSLLSFLLSPHFKNENLHFKHEDIMARAASVVPVSFDQVKRHRFTSNHELPYVYIYIYIYIWKAICYER